MARYIPPHPKKGSAEAKAWGARMWALRKKKNPKEQRQVPSEVKEYQEIYRIALKQVGDPVRAKKMVERWYQGKLQGEAIRAKKNPGAAWHETEAMSAAEQAARVTPGSRAASFYIGKRAAHTESAIESGARGMNPPPGTPDPQGWMLEKGTRKKAKVWMRWIVDAHGQGIGKMVVQREAQAWRVLVGYRYGKQWSYQSIGEYPSATKAMHAAIASLSENNPRRQSEYDVPTQHQIKIARSTLKMSDAGARIMGGMTKDQARTLLKRLGLYTGDIKRIDEVPERNPCRTKKNPIAIYNKPRVIYGKCLALYAQKTSGQYAGQRFKHTFKNPVVVIGNPDGSVLLKSTVGKKLWGG